MVGTHGRGAWRASGNASGGWSRCRLHLILADRRLSNLGSRPPLRRWQAQPVGTPERPLPAGEGVDGHAEVGTLTPTMPDRPRPARCGRCCRQRSRQPYRRRTRGRLPDQRRPAQSLLQGATAAPGRTTARWIGTQASRPRRHASNASQARTSGEVLLFTLSEFTPHADCRPAPQCPISESLTRSWRAAPPVWSHWSANTPRRVPRRAGWPPKWSRRWRTRTSSVCWCPSDAAATGHRRARRRGGGGPWGWFDRTDRRADDRYHGICLDRLRGASGGDLRCVRNRGVGPVSGTPPGR